MKGGKPPPASTQPAGQPPTLTPGMAALLRDNGARTPSSASSGPESKIGVDEGVRAPFSNRPWMLRGSLFLADLLLLGLAAWLVLKSDRPLSWGLVALCVLAVAMGAWLTCLGLWWEWKSSKARTDPGKPR